MSEFKIPVKDLFWKNTSGETIANRVIEA